MDAVGLLLDKITEALPEDWRSLRKLKIHFASSLRTPLVRNDSLLARYRFDVGRRLRPANKHVERILTLNRTRSLSGIATVTVATKPYACPGRCIYCPTEKHTPKSYLANEPAIMRALRNNYDPYRQVQMRLQTLHDTGHPTDKIELIVKGGTWSYYPKLYQQEFIKRCFEAANDFKAGPPGAGGTKSSIPVQIKTSGALEEMQQRNETAPNRIVGITVETRPDYVDEDEIRRLREFGVTRVELGVQTLEERVLALVCRDHGTAEIRSATRLLKYAGFKVGYHLMPNLPGATPRTDLEGFRELFNNPSYQPDTIKLYPCLAIRSAALYEWLKKGRYVPYKDETLIELLIQMKQLVPPSVRIERVIRDIPSTSIYGGCAVTNLREEIHRRMYRRNLRCRCIRCQQTRDACPNAPVLMRRVHKASEGIEQFLSFEDPKTDQLVSLLRLRIPLSPSNGQIHWLPVLSGAALIRELHTYGQHVPLHQRNEKAAQHQGFGMRLIREAERICCEQFRLKRIAAIAGIGARGYYRRLGYELEDSYMVKQLSR